MKRSWAVRIFRAAWAIYLLVILSGARSRYVGMAMVPISAACWALHGGSLGFFATALTGTDRFENSAFLKRGMVALTLLAALAIPVAGVLFHYALTQDLWDWGAYLQSTYTGAFLHRAFITGMDVRVDVADFHSTIVIPILVFLYRLFPSNGWLVAWHGAWLVLPAAIFVRALRDTHLRLRIPRDVFSECMLVFAFLLSPVISGNMQWPYHFHVPGMTFFALAFYFYARGDLAKCLLSLAVFSVHKEEFALFAAAFAGPIALDSRFSRRARVTCAMMLLFGGLAIYRQGAMHANSSFKDRFGNLGATPGEAARNLILDPVRYLRAWSSPASLKFMSFFLLATGGLFVRSRRILLLAIPCLPFLFLYGASDFWNMREFRHHYALPLAIGFFSVAVLGVLPKILERNPRVGWGRAYLLGLIAVSALWAQDTPFHSLRTAAREFSEHRSEQRFVDEIRKSPNDVICCEPRLCTYLTARPLYVQADKCLQGSTLIAEASPARVGVLVFQETLLRNPEAGPPVAGRVRLPSEWEYSTPYLKFAWVKPEKAVPVLVSPATK